MNEIQNQPAAVSTLPQEVSDDALEAAAGITTRGPTTSYYMCSKTMKGGSGCM